MMPDPSAPLVVTHPVLSAIGREEIERAIASSEWGCAYEHVEIAPLRTELAALDRVDWAQVELEQERLFAERLRPRMVGRSQLVYFGFAPIPLAVHLGYRAQCKADVYQCHHEREDWKWTSEEPSSFRPAMKPLNLPEHGSTDAGPVVIRVSTSYRIAPSETAEIIPRSLAEVDVGLLNPRVDALETRGVFAEVVRTFNHALSRLSLLFPNMTSIHLFAAIPVGLAFRLGTQINPTIHPDVVTYQYWKKGSPRYRRAIVLGAESSEERQEGHAGKSLTVSYPMELEAPFLMEPEYDWERPEATELHVILVSAYGVKTRIEMLVAQAGIERRRILFEQAVYDLWKDILEAAAKSGRLRALMKVICEDRSIGAFRPRLGRVLGGKE